MVIKLIVVADHELGPYQFKIGNNYNNNNNNLLALNLGLPGELATCK